MRLFNIYSFSIADDFCRVTINHAIGFNIFCDNSPCCQNTSCTNMSASGCNNHIVTDPNIVSNDEWRYFCKTLRPHWDICPVTFVIFGGYLQISANHHIISNSYPFRNTCIVANSGKISNYKIRGDQDVFSPVNSLPDMRKSNFCKCILHFITPAAMVVCWQQTGCKVKCYSVNLSLPVHDPSFNSNVPMYYENCFFSKWNPSRITSR